MEYHTGIPPQPRALTPVFRNFTFRHMHALSSGQMVWTGLPDSPVRHVQVHNVTIDVYDAHTTKCEYMADLSVSSLVANGRDITLETMSTCAGFPPPMEVAEVEAVAEAAVAAEEVAEVAEVAAVTDSQAFRPTRLP